MRIEVTHATPDEWKAIVKLREDYFNAVGEHVQPRSDDTKWFVALYKGHVVGCYSYTDTELGQRYLQDFFRAPGRMGTHAVAAMYSHLIKNADSEGMVLIATPHPFNRAMHLALLHRGFIPAMFSRPPKQKEQVA
jgi:hypothetical protein